ncbi:Uncharacterised protein g224 [Pycnogonum litorale]
MFRQKILFYTLLCLQFDYRWTAEYASKEEFKKLETLLQDVLQKINSLKTLQNAYSVIKIENRLIQMESKINGINDRLSSSEECQNNRGGHQQGPNSNQMIGMLVKLQKKVNEYGMKLLPNHNVILSKLLEMSKLIQSGFTKMLLSVSSQADLRVELGRLKTHIDNSMQRHFQKASVDQKTSVDCKVGESTEWQDEISVNLDDLSLSSSRYFRSLERQAEQSRNLTEKLLLSVSKKCDVEPTAHDGLVSSDDDGQCNVILRSLSSMLSGFEETKALLLNVHPKISNWRNTLDAHCHRQLFRAFRLCEDADDFISDLRRINRSLEFEKSVRQLNSTTLKLCNKKNVTDDEDS